MIRALSSVLLVLLTFVLGGCAALTDPVADAIPVRYLPPEAFGESKECCPPIPLTLLQQKACDVYRLAPGDVLGIWIEGVLGERTLAPPVHTSPPVQVRDQRRLPPSMGYPVPVREDGAIVLPMLAPIQVRGRTLLEVEETIRKLLREDKQILNPANMQIAVTLLQPRQYHVVVLREESSGFTQGLVEVVPTAKRGTGFSLDLAAGENDVLHALAVTGGLPGLDAYDEVIIEHGCFPDKASGEAIRKQLETQAGGPLPNVQPTSMVRIPLRWKPDAKLPFGPQDVVLHDGDIVLLRARDHDVFYTGGLLPVGMHYLPRDHDLDVVEAVASVRGPLINGAFVNNNLAGNLINPGIGFDNPSLLVVLRRLPNCSELPIRVDLNVALRDRRERIRVLPGDLLILQEQPHAAIARYVGTTMFNFSTAWMPFHSSSIIGVGDMQASQATQRIAVGTFATGPSVLR